MSGNELVEKFTRFSTRSTRFSQIVPQEFATFHSIPEAASRFSLEPREIIRHSACNATVEAKRDASQGRIRRRRRTPGFPALVRVALPHGVRRPCKRTAICNMPQRPVKRLRLAHCFPDAARQRRAVGAATARSVATQATGGASAPLCVRGLQGGSRTARCARRSR